MLDRESQRLEWDEQVCEMMTVSDDFRNKTRMNRELVGKYYKICRRTGRSAHRYGLPLIVERSLVEEAEEVS